MVSKPLQGMIVIDFSQFLSGPYAGLRLADLGARVIKIERPDGGDLCRRLYISNLQLDGDSTLFHAINRNKESFAADLKNAQDRRDVLRLLEKADMMIQNFRPGIIERLGFGYDEVKAINPRILYGSISGYGETGPFAGKPGQDLLVQSLSGIAWMSGGDAAGPVPFGLAIADMMAGAHLVQGLLAAAVRRSVTGLGAKVEVNLLESTLDTMQEVWADLLQRPDAGQRRNGAAYLRLQRPAPYGIYATADGYMALGACSVPAVGRAVGLPALERYDDPGAWTSCRDEIRRQLQAHLARRPTAAWLARLEPEGIPCAETLDWRRLLRHDAFRALRMTQQVRRPSGAGLQALCCPIRIDGQRFASPVGSPRIGEHSEAIREELAAGGLFPVPGSRADEDKGG